MTYAHGVLDRLPPPTASPHASPEESAERVDAVTTTLRDRNGVVPVSLVLEHVRPAYGGATWSEALAYLHANPAEAEVIEALVATGAPVFDAPIRVFRAEPDDRPDDEVADAVPDEAGTRWVIGNGMHRVAAAVAMGSPVIRCTTAEPSLEETADETYVEAEFTFPAVPAWSADGFDALDFLCGWLRSFPLPDGTWVEGDSFGARGEVFCGLWSCPPEHADALLAELQARFARFAPTTGDLLTFRNVRVCTGADLDAEFVALGLDAD